MIRKILVLVANSKNTSHEQFDEQVREINNGLQRSKHRKEFELVSKFAVCPRDIHQAMLDVKPQIVHFLGSVAGSQQQKLDNESDRKLVPLPEDETESEKLILEDETGQAKPVSEEALAALFKLFADKVECVVFNNFYSETQAKAIAQHIKFVVGMKQAISNIAALDFAVGFYDALGAGYSVKFAFDLGCAAIQLAGSSEHLTPVLHRDKFSLPPVIMDTTSESKSLEQHYNSLIEAITKGQLVPFLGSDINLCDRIQANGEIEPSWEVGSSFPPSGKELAAYLAKTFPRQAKPFVCPLGICNRESLQAKPTKPGKFPEGCPMNELIHEHALLICPLSKERLYVSGEPLQYLSQYAYLNNERRFYEQLEQVRLGYQPNQLHKFFATLPRIMREKGYYPPYPLIVTTNYDGALEKAFNDVNEPFDLVFYSNTIDAKEQDRFVHQTPDGTLHEIKAPNRYKGFSFDKRPVILKLYGTLEQIQEGESLVITEEHYMEYLVRDLSNLLPAKLLAKLRQQKTNMLFLGYPLGGWNQRISLHRIWKNLTSSRSRNRFPWWAIQSNVEPFARKLWEIYGVILYDLPFRDYITELEKRVRDIPTKGELRL